MNSTPHPPPDHPGLCRVRLEAFQGPLDVLLHLVRIDEIDVTTVSINEIARQCDEYLSLISDVDLETAGENLVLASTLLHLKSRRLLPPTTSEGDAAGDDGLLEPGDDLGWRDGMRRAAEELQEREAQMELVFTRPSERVAEFAGEELIEADLYSLLNAFQSILKRLGSETPAARITRERMTLVERIDWLLERLNRDQRIGFRDLFVPHVMHPDVSRPARGDAPPPGTGLREPPSGGHPDRHGRGPGCPGRLRGAGGTRRCVTTRHRLRTMRGVSEPSSKRWCSPPRSR
jgi:segregation and condensation protein A